MISKQKTIIDLMPAHLTVFTYDARVDHHYHKYLNDCMPPGPLWAKLWKRVRSPIEDCIGEVARFILRAGEEGE